MQPSIRTVGVVGTGVIGASWTALFLARGLKVLVSDPAPGAKERLFAYLQESWPMFEGLGLHRDASISNCTFVGESLEDHCGEVDFIQENAPERPDLKRKLLGLLDAKTKKHVVIASSSSGIPSSQFISECKYPERVLIGHPFNPPHLMPLVEVVPHTGTNALTVDVAMSFYKTMGKSPVLVNQECPGFVANRLQAALATEAYSLVKRGIVSAEACDICVTTGVGLRWAFTGPFMTNVLGGGGGENGFRHLLAHLGPAIEGWVKDMKDHAFEFSEENIQKLDNSVHKMLESTDVKEVEHQRDKALIDLINRKKDLGALK
ncbi:uncharacterized protein TrAFT101_006380 [Trichoderma asperellum]|uniref:3-hydroxyacyl-CoA dehydrogenase NAD binding domain-containing protein n=1 Tax=Trichoderma asperellum (strain ATCC 204424 / CBS 433.97 / NBRC 101777) TaxID=1042311 RepID=A0A2T3YQE5_TRIA4|nr:hypothetical protein M441DRAFT_154998 [Trichoderma asperellum CBS 433.97]PTB34736.1 hypothetical protein M441DRAFT_154998 [Trichoderma asperellum CBS 433.97]UKZ91400.1 hypothetical protein TrAFT101_006380 [Trichoderma asperellum]